jgi:hypothetical protein
MMLLLPLPLFTLGALFTLGSEEKLLDTDD